MTRLSDGQCKRDIINVANGLKRVYLQSLRVKFAKEKDRLFDPLVFIDHPSSCLSQVTDKCKVQNCGGTTFSWRGVKADK